MREHRRTIELTAKATVTAPITATATAENNAGRVVIIAETGSSGQCTFAENDAETSTVTDAALRTHPPTVKQRAPWQFRRAGPRPGLPRCRDTGSDRTGTSARTYLDNT